MLDRLKPVLSAAQCILATPVLLYLMAFAVAVLLGAPSRPRQSFWTPERLVYGLLMIAATLFLLSLTIRRWRRRFRRGRNAWLALFVVTVAGICIDTVVFLRLRGRGDEKIHLVWRADASVFGWGTGSVSVPAGFRYERLNGMDTFVGLFTSKERNLVIEYDIGELAAEHGGMGDRETLTEGSRVRFGKATDSDESGTKKYYFRASFPDANCANFSMESTSERDGWIVERIASSFRPQSWFPASMRPLLPEILRSDCRYRIRL